jgi:glycosyltransferase involved in cell wall biosynthesis
MNKSLVSVVIPTHNRGSLVVRAVESVLGQDYDALECIVVNDASTDNTKELLSAVQDPRLHVINMDAPGHASAARNAGIDAAKGDYIAFLDDDDEWLSCKLTKQVALMESAPQSCGMVYCWLDYYCDRERLSGRHATLRGWIFGEVFDQQRIGNASTLLVRARVAREINGFDEKLPRGNDGDFIRRVCRSYAVDVVPEVLVKVYVEHGYERITGVDEKSIRNAIRSQEDKLVKFKDDLKDYRCQTANIFAILGFHYAQLQDWKGSVANLGKAFLIWPFSLDLWRYTLRALKYLVFGLVRNTGRIAND